MSSVLDGVAMGSRGTNVTFISDSFQLPPFTGLKSSNRLDTWASLSILSLCVRGVVHHNTMVEQKCLVPQLATIVRTYFNGLMLGHADAHSTYELPNGHHCMLVDRMKAILRTFHDHDVEQRIAPASSFSLPLTLLFH